MINFLINLTLKKKHAVDARTNDGMETPAGSSVEGLGGEGRAGGEG